MDDYLLEIYTLAMMNMARTIQEHELELGLRTDKPTKESIDDLCQDYFNKAQDKA